MRGLCCRPSSQFVVILIVLIVLGLCRTFDCGETGKIPERKFRQIMKTKGVPESDVKEMLDGNFKSVLKVYLAFGLSRKGIKHRI